MPIETDVDPEHGFARHVGYGRLDKDAFIDALREIYAHPSYAAERGGFWDVRRAEVSALTADDMQDIAAFIRESQGPQPGRTAMVVARDVDFGFGRMYEVYADSVVNFRVFRDEDLARRWILEATRPGSELT